MQPGQSFERSHGQGLSGMMPSSAITARSNIGAREIRTTTFAGPLAAYITNFRWDTLRRDCAPGYLRALAGEINRKLADAICDRLYAPTAHARDKFVERRRDCGSHSGDRQYRHRARFARGKGPLEEARPGLKRRFSFIDETKKLLLVTCHRRESFGEGFRSVCEALVTLAERPDVQIVFPSTSIQRPVRFPAVGASSARLAHRAPELPRVRVYAVDAIHSDRQRSIQEEAPAWVSRLVMRKLTERPKPLPRDGKNLSVPTHNAFSTQLAKCLTIRPPMQQ